MEMNHILEMDRILAWHFLPSDGNLRYGAWRNPVVRPGVVFVHRGPIELCKRGLHASVRARDALSYAPGPIVCRVECWDRVQYADDKLVCGKRKVLWMADATRTLHLFALWCAEQALALVPSPDPRSVDALRVKRLWLDGKATDADLAAALDAAWAAAWVAAWAAARAATWAAARDAAWDAAGDAARTAARVAAGASVMGAQDAELERLLLVLGPTH